MFSLKFWTPISNWWWGDINNVRLHQNLDQNHVMNWKGGLTWFLALVGQRANGNAGILFNIFYIFSIFLYICPISKVSSRFRFASALPFSNPTFYRGLNSGLSCTCTDSRIFNAPNFAQNAFLCKSALQVDRTLMSFSFGKLFFFSRNPCAERESGGGELKIRTWQTLLLSNFPRIANSLCSPLNMAMNLFMRWPS